MSVTWSKSWLISANITILTAHIQRLMTTLRPKYQVNLTLTAWLSTISTGILIVVGYISHLLLPEYQIAIHNPSLLADLLLDDCGNPMSPSHSRKDNRRYRYYYYVSQAVLQYRDGDAGKVTRVPAQAIEQIVIERLKKLLRSQEELLDLMAKGKLLAKQLQELITTEAGR